MNDERDDRDESPDDAWLQGVLRKATPHLDDAGFSAQVMARLPPPRRRTDRRRPAILLGATLLAAALGIWALPLRVAMHHVAMGLSRPGSLDALPLMTALVLALIVWGAASVASTDS